MTFTLTENPDGTLTLARPGHDDVADVRLRRSFPWSKPDEFLSIRNDKGKEVLLVDRLADLSADQRSVVMRWLDANSFIPTITRLHSINNDLGYQEWTVDTDHGRSAFRVQEREDVRFLPGGRFTVKDTDGNVYALPPIDTLDKQSQKVAALIV